MVKDQPALSQRFNVRHRTQLIPVEPRIMNGVILREQPDNIGPFSRPGSARQLKNHHDNQDKKESTHGKPV